VSQTLLTVDSGSCVDISHLKRSIGQVSSTARTRPAAKAAISAVAAALSCPGSDGTIFTSNNNAFVIQCYQDHFGGDIGSGTTASLDACIALCTSTTNCIDVSFVPTDYYHPSVGTCWMKSSLQSIQPNGAVWGAQLVASSSAPSSTSQLAGVLQTFGTSKVQEGCSCLSFGSPVMISGPAASITSTKVYVTTSTHRSTITLTSTVLPVSRACYMPTWLSHS